MLKTVIDYPMDEERMVVRQNLKGYEKVNQVVSVEFWAQEAVREVYMDEKSYILISFCHSIPRKI
jgi:hypothetical protein